MKDRIQSLLAWAGGLGIVAGIVALAWTFGGISLLFHKSEPVGVSKPAEKSADVKRVPLVTVAAPKGVRVYQPEAKLKLNLPPTVIANKDEQVISTARVDNTVRPHTVTTTINTETGEAQSFVRADPYPWVALESRGEVGVSAGYKYRYDRAAGLASVTNSTQPTVRIDARHDFLQIKAFHLGVIGTLDSDRDLYFGARLSYKW